LINALKTVPILLICPHPTTNEKKISAMAAILTSITALLPAAEQVPAGKTATESVAPPFTDQRREISPGLSTQRGAFDPALTRHLR
jgi:hypothetical protein